MLIVVVDLESSEVIVSYGFVACLQLKPDNQVKINIASLNIVEKKSRDVFFEVPLVSSLTYVVRSLKVSQSFDIELWPILRFQLN